MIHLAVDYCKCHMIPADQCKLLQSVSKISPRLSGVLTYEVIIPPLEYMRKNGSDELNEALDIVLGGTLPGGKKEANVS